jgi:hypothetical protein
MRLLRLQDVEIGPNDRVFRHPRLRALIVWLAAFFGTTALFYYAYTAKFAFGYFFGAFALLFLLVYLRMVTARFHPSNWLARMNDTGFYVQFRSYLNYELSAEVPSVVFFSFGEIASARLIKERLETPDPARQNTTQTQFLHHIELELPGDTAALAEALSNERGQEAPSEKHWYGTSATMYRDYPVTLNGPFLRIHWNVVPRTHTFLKLLRPYTIIADPVSVTNDFSKLRSLNREDQQKRLRELDARGDRIGAVYAASQLYRCSLTDATNLITSLRESKVSS